MPDHVLSLRRNNECSNRIRAWCWFPPPSNPNFLTSRWPHTPAGCLRKASSCPGSQECHSAPVTPGSDPSAPSRNSGRTPLRSEPQTCSGKKVEGKKKKNQYLCFVLPRHPLKLAVTTSHRWTVSLIPLYTSVMVYPVEFKSIKRSAVTNVMGYLIQLETHRET